MRRPVARDWALLSAVLVMLGGAVAATRASGLRVQHSSSLPIGFYRDIPGARPTRGAIGVWCLPTDVARWARARGYIGRGTCPAKTEPIGKIVLAVAGDTIDFGPEGVVRDGRRVPGSRPLGRDARGRPLPAMRFGRYVLATDQVWLWSPYSARSFDSRYFGPVRTRTIVSIVRPLITIESMPESR